MILAVLLLMGCNPPGTTRLYPTSSPVAADTATLTGRIVLGYGDHRPVADLPLWIGLESRGQPVTRTNANGEFTLSGLPVGETVDVVDDHLSFQVRITHPGLIDLGTLEYPLVHPSIGSGGKPTLTPLP